MELEGGGCVVCGKALEEIRTLGLATVHQSVRPGDFPLVWFTDIAY